MKLKLNSENFEKEVLNSNIPVLVDFYADWCGPCKMLAPVLEELEPEYPEIRFVRVNVDEEDEKKSHCSCRASCCLTIDLSEREGYNGRSEDIVKRSGGVELFPL